MNLFKKNSKKETLSTSLRHQFPIILNNPRIAYLDNACSTLRPQAVIDSISNYYSTTPGCSRRASHRFGEKTTIMVEETRRLFSSFIGAKSQDEISFTKNTTEAINIISNGITWSEEDYIVTTNIEHNSNLIPWMRIAETKAVKLKLFSVDKEGSINSQELVTFILQNPVKLLTLHLDSHLISTNLEIEELIKACRKKGTLILLDCAQSLLHRLINIQKLDVDFAAFSFHKALGPSGMGALYIKTESQGRIIPSQYGGDTVTNVKSGNYHLNKFPHVLEAGLQNYAGIAGVNAALKFINNVGPEQIIQQTEELSKLLHSELRSIRNISFLGDPKKAYPIILFRLNNLQSDELAKVLDTGFELLVRSGVHCCHEWFNKNDLGPYTRASLGFYNSEEEIYRLRDALIHLSR